MAGIRIEALCKQFSPLENFGEYPEGLVDNVQTLCLGAAHDGNPAVLTTEEAFLIEDHFPLKFNVGVFRTAEALANAVWPQPIKEESPQLELQAIARGFRETSLSEPQFLSNGFVFKKLGGNDQRQTILINNTVTVQIKTTDSEFPYRQIAKELQKKTGRLGEPQQIATELTAAVLALPFMENYRTATGSQSNDWRYNNTSVLNNYNEPNIEMGNIQVTVDGGKRIELLWVDPYGRFFVKHPIDGTEIQYYLDSPKNFGNVVAAISSHKNEDSRFSVGSREIASNTPASRGSCFAAGAWLATEEGPQTFASIYQRYRQGEALPPVAVYDADSQTPDYQTPARITRTFLTKDSEMQMISFAGDLGMVANPLEVTPNHNLWARRHGEEFWMPARNLVIGDELLTDQAGEKQWVSVTGNSIVSNEQDLDFWKSWHAGKPSVDFDAIASRPATGALDVYNIVFEDGSTHNFAVSSTGTEWFVAHNKTF